MPRIDSNMHPSAFGSIVLFVRRVARWRWLELLVIVGSISICLFVSVSAVPYKSGLWGASLGILAIWVAVIDLHFFRIPDVLVICIGLLGLLSSIAVVAPNEIPEALAVAAARGAGFALPFLVLRQLYSSVRGREGLGLGDVKLAAAGGVWLAWVTMPIAIEIAALSALLLYASRRVLAGRPIQMTARVPFGLFLAPAIWVAWLIQSVQWSGAIGP